MTQPRQKLCVNPAKPAVAEDNHNVPTLNLLRQVRNYRIGIG